MKELNKKGLLPSVDRLETLNIANERISEITREFSEGFRFLADYPSSVTFFGSTESKEGDKHYEDARELAKRIVTELNYSIVSGGGPGIMEASDRGAYEAGGNSIGLLIELPEGQVVNKYITKSVSFHYFFARKVCLTFGAEVFIFYPGGFGTLDEFFELITLVQTKKLLNVPIICVGTEYWSKLKDFMQAEILKRGYIKDGDQDLFTITDSHDEILEVIKKTPILKDVPFNLKDLEYQK